MIEVIHGRTMVGAHLRLWLAVRTFLHAFLESLGFTYCYVHGLRRKR
jgi:hypothetical protein